MTHVYAKHPGTLTPIKTYLTFAILVLIASLNRETGAFLVLAYALMAYRCNRLNWRYLALLAAIWLATFVGLRLILGAAETRYTLAFIWQTNMARMPGGLLYLILCAGGVLYAAAAGWRYAPGFVRALWPVVVLYIGAILALGVWGEVRLWLPILPLVVAGALSAVNRGAVDSIMGSTDTKGE